MRPTLQRFSLPTLVSAILLPLCLSQTSGIQVGDGATTTTIRDEFLAAYQRNDFLSTVALPPLTEVVAYGTGGFRQEFQDAAKTGIRSALIRPAVPDLTLGVNNAVRQVRQPVYALYTTSAIGPSTAGFPSMDTTRFNIAVSGSPNTFIAGSYQTFDKNFAIFVWDQPPLDGQSDTKFNVLDPIFTRWKSATFDLAGAPVGNQVTVTARYGTKANYQVFTGGGIYNITSGTLSGKTYYLRKAVQDLYDSSQGPASFLGLPNNDETVLADGRRRQSFEGGTMEYALNGTPVLKNALQVITVAADDPVRLTTGQTITLTAVLQTIAGEFVTDRDVFWTTSNGRVVTVTGTGPQVTVKAVGGGTAIITATSEGKSSNRIAVQVASQCCAIGEGAPTAAISQTFVDAITRNRLTVRTPIATPVRRVGAGYAQEAIALPSGNRIVIAKADSSPVAYVITGATLASYEASGSFTGTLGFPISDITAGQTQRFENGALAGSPVRLVSGPILTRWLALAGDTGALGPPVSAAMASITFSGNQVTTQQFRSGYIFQHDSGALAGRAFVTTGVIAAKHLELGLAPGQIGAPMTDEFLGASGYRQEFEGAFLEYTPGTAVRVIDKSRRPTLTVTPSSLLTGGRYRVAVGGFAANSRLRLTQGSGTSADTFDIVAANGSYVWESIVPANARAGVVVLRATDLASAQTFADGSYTVRALSELKPALSKVSGDSQSGAPAVVLSAPLRVVLRDSAGNPLSGVAIRFEASPGAAIVDSSAITDGNGIGEARLRLPASTGVVLVSVEAGGQLVTFSARAIEQTISDFPRITQAVDGNLGTSNQPLALKGSLLASMAAVIRFFQQRGVAPADNGLADTAILNTYLRNLCAIAVDGSQLCDGFLDLGAGEDPQPNPFRALDFASGSLTLSFVDPKLPAIRDAFSSTGPMVLGLQLSRNGASAGTHFVSVTGILADGDLAIFDPNPQFNLTRLSQYTTGFTASAATWKASITTALQFSPRPGATAFYAYSGSPFAIASPAAPCTSVASWPATFAHLGSTATATSLYLQSCDGTAGAYQAAVPAAPFLLSLVSLTNPAARSIVSAANATAYRVSRNNGDYWSLSPEQTSFNAGSIVNAASFGPAVAPGTIISVFGNGLPLQSGSGSEVSFNGQSMPIFFSNGFQLNTALPANASVGPGTLTVRSPFGESSSLIELSDVAPAVFVMDVRGSAAALNQDYKLNTNSNPSARGQAVILFGTGFGAVTQRNDGLAVTVNPVTVILSGRELTPFFAGLAPGFVGLYQINVSIPITSPPGLDQTLSLRAGGVTSNIGLLSVR